MYSATEWERAPRNLPCESLSPIFRIFPMPDEAHPNRWQHHCARASHLSFSIHSLLGMEAASRESASGARPSIQSVFDKPYIIIVSTLQSLITYDYSRNGIAAYSFSTRCTPLIGDPRRKLLPRRMSRDDSPEVLPNKANFSLYGYGNPLLPYTTILAGYVSFQKYCICLSICQPY